MDKTEELFEEQKRLVDAHGKGIPHLAFLREDHAAAAQHANLVRRMYHRRPYVVQPPETW